MSDQNAVPPPPASPRRRSAHILQWVAVLISIVSAAAAIASAGVAYVALNQHRQAAAFQEILSACVDAEESGLEMQTFLGQLRDGRRPPIAAYESAHRQLSRATSRLKFLAPVDLGLEEDATIRSMTLSVASTRVLDLVNAGAPSEDLDAALLELTEERRRMDEICVNILQVQSVVDIDSRRHRLPLRSD